MTRKKRVLFVCSRNSARSQMAEGWLRHLAGDQFDVYSAGVEPGTLNPLAVQVMAEVGIDISQHRPQGILVYLGHISLDILIVVCDQAEQRCPRIWPGIRERHFWPFPDPVRADGDDNECLAVFREVRDAIRQKIENWLQEEQKPSEAV